MTKEIQRAGIPIVHVTNLVNISEGLGAHRIYKGNSVLHVFGKPTLPVSQEKQFRQKMLENVIGMLSEVPNEGEHSIVKENA